MVGHPGIFGMCSPFRSQSPLADGGIEQRGEGHAHVCVYTDAVRVLMCDCIPV